MPRETAESKVYHIVCHDCPTEFVSQGESKAQKQLSEHESETNHHVEFAALD
jgi:hypothetical protein